MVGGCTSLICKVIADFIDLINLLIPVLAGVAVAVFMVSAILYIARSGDVHKKEKHRQSMVWGLVALFLLFSIWGILRLLDNSFFGGGGGAPLDIRPERAIDSWEGLR